MRQRDWFWIGLLIVGWIVILGQPAGVSAKLRAGLAALTTPFVKLGDYIPTIRARRDLQQQNDKLRTENDRLRQLLHAYDQTETENLSLHALLNLKRRTGYTTLAARVIGRDASNWYKTIQLDRGTADGVTANLAVLSAAGLVGKTIRATTGESRVLLLLDPNCRVSALLGKSRATGIVSGSDDSFNRVPTCQLTYLDRATTVTAGEPIVTSGLGGVYPKGVLVGHAGRAALDTQSGMYQTVTVKPAADFQKLEYVVVVLAH